MKRAAFTLIELLVVTAVISILAAIAIPNLMEAQTRAKTARAQADLRTYAGALETYRVDHAAYPPSSGLGPFAMPMVMVNPISARLHPLTTPIAYLSRLPADVFRTEKDFNGFGIEIYDIYDYLDAATASIGSGLTSGGAWRMSSAGPDLLQAWGGRTAGETECAAQGVDYDPTNGTVSPGDIVRTGPRVATRNGMMPDNPLNPQRPAWVRVM